MKKYIVIALTLMATFCMSAQGFVDSEWNGKRVAYLGDSMTDPNNNAADTKYWQCLQDMLGIQPYVFARSGYQWRQLMSKCEHMRDSLGQEVDAIIIWCGTNDYNHNVPIGKFYAESVDSVNVNGEICRRKHREMSMDDTTFCGCINRVLSFLKSNYPTKQIIVMTPIHRGYANFSKKNVQPDETYANGLGLYIEDYVDVLKRGAQLWAVPVIDLFQISGLYPNLESNTMYVGNAETDRLHPNNAGHMRIARTMQRQLLGLPSTF